MINFDPQFAVLAKAMSLRLQRHSLVSSNIAHADTPGYRPKVVAFEGELQQATKTKNFQNIERVQGQIGTVDDGNPRLDGNTVNIDKQMGMLAENALMYNATAEFLARKIRMLKQVLN